MLVNFFLIQRLRIKFYAKFEVLYKVPHEALREALHKALHEVLHKVLYEALHEALHKAPHQVPAIFPIASTHTFAKYTPILPPYFLPILSSLYPPYLGRHQNGSQQRTVAKTRRPPFKRPASERREQFNQLIDRIKPEL